MTTITPAVPSTLPPTTERTLHLAVLGTTGRSGRPLVEQALATSLMIPRQVRDGHAQLQMLEASDLDWTVVRAPELTEGLATGQFRVGYLPRPALARISRSDVASALLSQLADPRWQRQAPVVLA